MLLGDDVFNVKPGQWRLLLGEAAIFAPIVSALADELAQSAFHHEPADRARSARAFAWRIETKSIAAT